MGEMFLCGQGEMYLCVVQECLFGKYGLDILFYQLYVFYVEIICGLIKICGCYKKQFGGYGQFGDVLLEIVFLFCGEGFYFSDCIIGGVVFK